MEKLRYKLLSAAMHFGFIFWMYACSDDAIPGVGYDESSENRTAQQAVNQAKDTDEIMLADSLYQNNQQITRLLVR